MLAATGGHIDVVNVLLSDVAKWKLHVSVCLYIIYNTCAPLMF